MVLTVYVKMAMFLKCHYYICRKDLTRIEIMVQDLVRQRARGLNIIIRQTPRMVRHVNKKIKKKILRTRFSYSESLQARAPCVKRLKGQKIFALHKQENEWINAEDNRAC